jgi:hypothetical protein
MEKNKKRMKTAAYQTLDELGVGHDRDSKVETALSVAEDIDNEAKNLGLTTTPKPSALIKTVLQHIGKAEMVPVFAPSCPDYQNNGTIYTFGKVGEEVSLLARYQAEFASKFLPILQRHSVDYDYILLTADIEEQDTELIERNGSDLNSFRQKIRSTVTLTGDYLAQALAPPAGSKVRSAGFFEEFGGFIELQTTFETLIHHLREDDPAFGQKLEDINHGRFYGLYTHLFGNSKSQAECMPRTIRTMGQYAALGHLARQKGAIITCHETLNAASYNNHKLSLEENAETAFRRIPVLNFGRRIY